MTTYLPRGAWRARPPKPGPGNLTPSRVAGVVIHWPGMTKPVHSYDGVASALRGWQAYHMDTRDWSDIAYQVAVDQAGRAWTLRGLRTQSGANGDTDVNERYGAILLVLAPGEEPTEAMADTVREVVADLRELYPHCEKILPHGAVRPEPTDCPGPAARAAIARGDFNPGTPQEDDVQDTDIEKIAERVMTLLEPRLKAYAESVTKWESQTDGADAQRAGDSAEREILRPENLDKIATAVVDKLQAGS